MRPLVFLLNAPSSPATARRSEELFCEHQDKIYKRTDHMFAGLMVFQWLVGIIAAVWISPKTWMGTQSQIHWHVWAALILGGAITILPVLLAWKLPGHTMTRHAIAVGQMLTSALLIQLSGGRVETHFHIFGSLAFLAFYRDWRVLISATVVVAADHFLRGTFWPQSVFGILTSSPWSWIEHAAWVVFEDFFLLFSIHQSLAETRMVAERQAKLEAINQGIEKLVRERTSELEQSHKQLVETSRQAGMAEVATSGCSCRQRAAVQPLGARRFPSFPIERRRSRRNVSLVFILETDLAEAHTETKSQSPTSARTATTAPASGHNPEQTAGNPSIYLSDPGTTPQ